MVVIVSLLKFRQSCDNISTHPPMGWGSCLILRLCVPLFMVFSLHGSECGFGKIEFICGGRLFLLNSHREFLLWMEEPTITWAMVA
jgi:hypothetical protein